jgi:hypothetical protein
MNRVEAGETAFHARDAAFMVSVEATWDDPHTSGENLTWAREAWRSLWNVSTETLYVNFPGLAEEQPDVARTAFGGNFDRLAELKATYDPEDRFRPHRNISIPADATDG